MNSENETIEQATKKPANLSFITYARWMSAIMVVTLLSIATDGVSNPIWWFTILGLLIYGISCNLTGFKKGAQWGFEDGLETGYKKGVESGARLGTMLQGLSEAMNRMSGEEPPQKKKEEINPQEQLNQLLDKINASGINSLSPQEKDLLNKLAK